MLCALSKADLASTKKGNDKEMCCGRRFNTDRGELGKHNYIIIPSRKNLIKWQEKAISHSICSGGLS